MKKLDDLLKTETDQRLLRLFAVGCCRQIWEKLIDERSRKIVEVTERFADGQATLEELKKDYDAAWGTARAATYSEVFDASWSVALAAVNYVSHNAVNNVAHDAAWITANAAANTATWITANVAANAAAWIAAFNAAFVNATERQLELHSCLFTKIVFSTTNQNALNLAKLIYEERQWSLMPILGDALEEAGGTEEAISHCKEKEHARGCWVVDSILRKR